MKKLLMVAVTAWLLVAASQLAHADIIFLLGNNPSGDVNVLLNSGGTGTTVFGSLNGFPTLTVVFSSSQTLSEPSSGQARISGSPEGTPLTNITISLANGQTYGDIILNPFVGGCQTCAGGASTITVNALSSNGTPETVVFSGLTVGNGSNFITIRATNGEQIVSTSLSVPGGFNDLRQPRLSGPFGAVPESATMLLVSGGLGIMALIRYRKLKF